MNALRQWALNIRDLPGFMLRAFISAFVSLGMIFVLMVLTLPYVHPLASTFDVFRQYLTITLPFLITVPLIWLGACYFGIAKWYVSYSVGVLHAVFACVMVNLTRSYFIPNASETIYFSALSQSDAFVFVLLAEFCYFWLLVGLGSWLYVYLTERWFPTMATWFHDDPMDQSAPVSPYRKQPRDA